MRPETAKALRELAAFAAMAGLSEKYQDALREVASLRGDDVRIPRNRAGKLPPLILGAAVRILHAGGVDRPDASLRAASGLSPYQWRNRRPEIIEAARALDMRAQL